MGGMNTLVLIVVAAVFGALGFAAVWLRRPHIDESETGYCGD